MIFDPFIMKIYVIALGAMWFFLSRILTVKDCASQQFENGMQWSPVMEEKVTKLKSKCRVQFELSF